MIQKILKDTIVKELAKKYKMSQDDIITIVDSPFNFLASIMNNIDRKNINTYKNVKIPYLGKFFVTEKRKQKLIEKLKNIDNE